MSRLVVLVVPQSVWISKEHLPSIGLAYIAAVLEAEGFRVKILDCQAVGLSLDEALDEIIELRPDVVGLTATSHSRFWAIHLAQKIKASMNVLLIAGGVHFSLTALDLLENVPEIDVVVKGEGEFTTKYVLNAWFSGNSLARIPGIAFRDSQGKPGETLDAPFISQLDSLPDPAWHCFDMQRYSASLEGCPPGGRAIGVMSSRGCPFSCSFCSNKAFWRRRLRHFSPARFVDQIIHLHNSYGITDFDFWDDTFTIVENHAKQICDLIIKSTISPRIYFRSRVDTINRPLLETLRKAGGISIGYGVESGSQRILENISKGITIEKAKEVIKLSIDLGFHVKAFFMASLPGETLDDVNMTMDLVDEFKQYGGDRIKAGYGFPTTIYPGTDIEKLAYENGQLPKNFSWNRYYEFPQMKELNLNPTLLCFENSSLSLKAILKQHKLRMDKLISKPKDNRHRFLQNIKHIRLPFLK